MTIAKTKAAGWGANELLSSAQATAIDTNVTNALDKRAAQTDTLGSIVSCVAPGRVVRSSVVGSNANLTYNVGTAQMIVATSASASASAVTYTLSTSIATPIAGDEIIVFADNTYSLALSGAVTATNASTVITFVGAQTISAGTAITFASQPGVWYYLASAMVATTTGALTGPFLGATGATTANVGCSVVIVSSDFPGTTLYTLGLSPLADGPYVVLEFNGTTWKTQTYAGPRLRAQTFLVAGTFNVPIGVSVVMVEGCGGGGGGSGGAPGTASDNVSATGGSGGGGAIKVSKWVPVVSGGTAAVTIGAAGAGSGYNATAGDGGNTIFAGLTTVTMRGAAGGVNSSGTTSASVQNLNPSSPTASSTSTARGAYPSAATPSMGPQWGGYGVNIIGFGNTGVSGGDSPEGFAGGVGVVNGGSLSPKLAGGSGGGGGGGPYNTGGAGGAGGPGNNAGVPGAGGGNGVGAAANSGGGGGGGGAGGCGVGGFGANGVGASGGTGQLTVLWVK